MFFFVFFGVFVLLGGGVFVLFGGVFCSSRVSAIFCVVFFGVARIIFRAKPSKAGNLRSHDRAEPTGSNEYQAPPFPLLNGNLGATQKAVNNPTTSVGSRHLDLRYFRAREYIKSMKLPVSHIFTKLNVADLFTKPLIYGAFSLFGNFLGIVEPPRAGG